MIEIRWHGRGGQGAKSTSHLMALALLEAGLHVQAFPEYGPERSGAPVMAYNRIDDAAIRRRNSVTRPDVVVVLDPTLLDDVDVTRGLPSEGLLLVNTEESPDELRPRHSHTGSTIVLPADDMARAVGAKFSNMVILGALAAVLDKPPLDTLRRAALETFGHKLAPAQVRATFAALEVGHSLVDPIQRWQKKLSDSSLDTIEGRDEMSVDAISLPWSQLSMAGIISPER
ncbi:MAG: 2-oxoacid:acceptor oxidoreductase family protein, partial [Bradymonadaceae bacterium]